MTHVRRTHTVQFVRYSIAGTASFVFDLSLLWFLTDVCHVYYLVSAGLAYALATSLNYLVARSWAFRGTSRNVLSGYVYFFGIAGTGLGMVLVLMHVAVDIFHVPYLIARIGIAVFVGIWNFLMNKYINLKV